MDTDLKPDMRSDKSRMSAWNSWHQEHIVEGRAKVREIQVNEIYMSEVVMALESRARHLKGKMEAARSDDIVYTTLSSRYSITMQALANASKEAEKHLVDFVQSTSHLRAAEKQLRTFNESERKAASARRIIASAKAEQNVKAGVEAVAVAVEAVAEEASAVEAEARAYAS